MATPENKDHCGRATPTDRPALVDLSTELTAGIVASDALQAAVAVACRTLALEDAEAALRRGYQEALEWCAANGAPGPPDSLSVVYDRLSALSWRMRREVYGDDLCGSRP